MKKLICFLLAAVCCVSLTGCSGSEDESGSGPAEPTAQADISDIPDITEPENKADSPDNETSVSAPSGAEPVPAETAEPTVEAVLPMLQPYAGMVSELGNDFLGLPSMEKVYIFQNSGDTATVDGTLCYGVSCYDEHEGVLYFMCDYYVSGDGTAVYRYYESEDRYALLPERQAVSRLDPTAQSPEEIFAVSNELYAMFALSTLECDETVSTEQNGWIYYLVADERFDTMGELMDALGKYFSDELINSLMDSDQFITGSDGRMYYRYLARGIDPAYNGTRYELTSLTDDEAVFTAYSEFIFDGEPVERQYSYTVQKQYGVWRFVNYMAPWE